MGLNLPVIDISPFISWPDEGPPDETGAAAATAAAPPPAETLAAPRDAASMTPAQRTTVAALRAAVRHPGFFYLVGHGVPRALMDEVVRLGRSFYEDNDAGAKGLVARRDVGDGEDGDGDGARGWQDVDADQNDWHEALDFYAEIPADALEAHRRFKAQGGGAWAGAPGLLEGRNRWPRHPAALRPALEAYVPRLCAVGTAVLRALGHALELADPDFFVARTRDSFWCLRVLGYPPLPPPVPTAEDEEEEEEEELAGCGEHSDYGCLTLLLTDPSPAALKVKVPPAPPDTDTDTAAACTKEEEEGEATWVDADPVPGAYVVNIGDMVEQWTGGWAMSTRHKVLHAGARYRVSVPFFFEPAKDVVVRRLPEFGGTDADPAVRYWDHLVSKIDGSFFRRRTTW